MAESRIFSTGILQVFPGVRGSSMLPDPTSVLSGSPLVGTRTVNSGAMYSDTPANICDGNGATVCAVNAHTGASLATSNDWFVVDTTEPYTLTQVTTQITAQGSGTNTVRLWLADRAAAQPGDPDTTMIDSWTAAIATHTTTVANLQGRYLLVDVVNTGASSVTIAEITATVYAGMILAILQSIKLSTKTKVAKLYGAAWVNPFPADVGFSEGDWEFEATNASIRHDTLRKLIGAVETTGTDPVNSASTYIETLNQVVALPSFSAVLQTQSNDATPKLEVWTLFNCRAPGVEIPYKTSDFSMPKFNFCAYPDANNNMGQVRMDQ